MNTLKQSDRTDHQPELVAARSYDDSGGDETLRNFADFTAIYFDSPQPKDAGEDVSVFLADKSPGCPRLAKAK